MNLSEDDLQKLLLGINKDRKEPLELEDSKIQDYAKWIVDETEKKKSSTRDWRVEEIRVYCALKKSYVPMFVRNKYSVEEISEFLGKHSKSTLSLESPRDFSISDWFDLMDMMRNDKPLSDELSKNEESVSIKENSSRWFWIHRFKVDRPRDKLILSLTTPLFFSPQETSLCDGHSFVFGSFLNTRNISSSDLYENLREFIDKQMFDSIWSFTELPEDYFDSTNTPEHYILRNLPLIEEWTKLDTEGKQHIKKLLDILLRFTETQRATNEINEWTVNTLIDFAEIIFAEHQKEVSSLLWRMYFSSISFEEQYLDIVRENTCVRLFCSCIYEDVVVTKYLLYGENKKELDLHLNLAKQKEDRDTVML